MSTNPQSFDTVSPSTRSDKNKKRNDTRGTWSTDTVKTVSAEIQFLKSLNSNHIKLVSFSTVFT